MERGAEERLRVRRKKEEGGREGGKRGEGERNETRGRKERRE